MWQGNKWSDSEAPRCVQHINHPHRRHIISPVHLITFTKQLQNVSVYHKLAINHRPGDRSEREEPPTRLVFPQKKTWLQKSSLRSQNKTRGGGFYLRCFCVKLRREVRSSAGPARCVRVLWAVQWADCGRTEWPPARQQSSESANWGRRRTGSRGEERLLRSPPCGRYGN